MINATEAGSLLKSDVNVACACDIKDFESEKDSKESKTFEDIDLIQTAYISLIPGFIAQVDSTAEDFVLLPANRSLQEKPPRSLS